VVVFARKVSRKGRKETDLTFSILYNQYSEHFSLLQLVVPARLQ